VRRRRFAAAGQLLHDAVGDVVQLDAVPADVGDPLPPGRGVRGDRGEVGDENASGSRVEQERHDRAGVKLHRGGGIRSRQHVAGAAIDHDELFGPGAAAHGRQRRRGGIATLEASDPRRPVRERDSQFEGVLGSRQAGVAPRERQHALPV
jgi:hypothetical protein